MAASPTFDLRVDPLWDRSLHARAVEHVEDTNNGARARMCLARLLARCHADVGIVVVHSWPRHVQGKAYLWAIDYLAGHEDVPRPWEP